MPTRFDTEKKGRKIESLKKDSLIIEQEKNLEKLLKNIALLLLYYHFYYL